MIFSVVRPSRVRTLAAILAASVASSASLVAQNGTTGNSAPPTRPVALSLVDALKLAESQSEAVQIAHAGVDRAAAR